MRCAKRERRCAASREKVLRFSRLRHLRGHQVGTGTRRLNHTAHMHEHTALIAAAHCPRYSDLARWSNMRVKSNIIFLLLLDGTRRMGSPRWLAVTCCTTRWKAPLPFALRQQNIQMLPTTGAAEGKEGDGGIASTLAPHHHQPPANETNQRNA